MLLTTYADVQQGIDLLEGRSRAAARWSADLRPAEFLTAVPLARMGRFGDDDDRAPALAARALTRLIAGFRGAQAPWGWLVSAEDERVTAHGLVPQGAAAAHVWKNTAEAALPGSSFGAPLDPAFMARLLAKPAWLVSFLGSHPVTLQQPEPRVPDLSRLALAMRGAPWNFLVLARPVPPPHLTTWRQALHQQIQETRRSFLRRGTAEEGQHSLPQRYLELLEAENSRLLAGERTGFWEVQACLLADDPAVLAAGAQIIPGHLSETRLSLTSWRAVTCNADASGARAASYLTTPDVASLLALPLGECAGSPVRARVAFAQNGAAAAPGAAGIAIGRVMSESAATQTWFEIPVHDLTRHGLICGTPGSGKTRTAQFLLRQLWEEHAIPFLVLDPAKSEYGEQLHSLSGGALRVFAPGRAGAAPFAFNPLAVPAGVPVQMHADGVRALLLASFGWVPPMPEVLTLAVHELYERKGWNFHTGTHPRGHTAATQPTLSELIQLIPSVVLECGYDPEVSANIEAGLCVRLGSLIRGARGAVLNTTASLPLSQLLDRPTVIEMGWFGNNEERAFLLGALILALGNHRRMQGTSARLRHVLLIEEAHRLLSAPSGGGGATLEFANPQQRAIGEFCQLLAEIRSCGQGLLIVEQMPTKLPPDLLANTTLKVCHHLVREDDRHALGATMNLRPDQTRFLASLQPGEALAIRAGQDQPFHLTVPDHTRRLAFPHPLPLTA